MFPIIMLLSQNSKPRTKLKHLESGQCCRTCLSKESLQDIFTESESMKGIKKYLKLTTGLEVDQNDGLSQKICIRCLKVLKMAVQFRYASHRAYKFLLKVKNLKTETSIKDENLNKTCWIEVKPLETNQNRIKYEDFDSNDIENDGIDNDEIDNKDIFDTSDRIDNDTVDNGNDFGESEDDCPLNNLKALKNLKQKKQPIKSRRTLDIPFADSYKCEVCGKEFTHRGSYRSHVRYHTEFIMCELCGKKFRSVSVLRSHKSAIHGLEKMYKCNSCEYSSSYKEALQIHQRLHTGEKPYQCDHCGDSFHRRRILIQHLARHTAEYNIKCPICPKTFRAINQLYYHKYRVHPKQFYRYGCTICERTYRRPYLVRKHARMDHEVEIGPVRKIPIDKPRND